MQISKNLFRHLICAFIISKLQIPCRKNWLFLLHVGVTFMDPAEYFSILY